MPHEIDRDGSSLAEAGQAERDQTDGMVARADLLLEVMSQQAAAARAEAQYAELRLLVAEARAGDSTRLQLWLRQHDGGDVGVGTGPRPVPNKIAYSPSIASWEDLLPHARRRLAARTGEVGGSEALRVASASPFTAPGLRQRFDAAHDSRALADTHIRGDTSQSSSPPGPGHAEGEVSDGSPKTEDAQRLAALAEKFAAQLSDKKGARYGKFITFSRRRGLTASALAHVLLLALLAFVTLKPPTPPASLAFDASSTDATAEIVELTQPMEVSPPSDAAEMSTASEAFDLSENLAEATASVTSVLGDMSPVLSPPVTGSGIFTVTDRPDPLHANASFFGAAASGNCFCYVIDGSASMRDGPWEAAKQELLKSLGSLTEKQRFYVIFYNRELNAIPAPGEREPAARALYANSENLQHARRWIDTLRIGFGAPPNAALKLAIEKEPDAIYLLTDGDTKVDVAKFLREENRISDIIHGEQVRVPIHSIAFYSLDGQRLLMQIAAENSGQFVYVPDPRRR